MFKRPNGPTMRNLSLSFGCQSFAPEPETGDSERFFLKILASKGSESLPKKTHLSSFCRLRFFESIDHDFDQERMQ
jgi:hypothetical protein